MSTHRTTPAGSVATPPTPAARPAGSEVMAPVGATAATAAGGQGPATPDLGAAEAAVAFRTALGPLIDLLSPHLRRPLTGTRIGSVRNTHEAAAPRVAALLREFPQLASAGDPETIDRGSATLTAMRALAVTLKVLAGEVEDTGRMAFDDGWIVARTALETATPLAKRDKNLAEALTPVRDLLRQGPRVVAAGRSADAAARKADAAQTRAARAQQRAQAASQSHTRAIQAHAARHPTAGTPVPAAVSQGPAVNPQGPAPGR